MGMIQDYKSWEKPSKIWFWSSIFLTAGLLLGNYTFISNGVSTVTVVSFNIALIGMMVYLYKMSEKRYQEIKDYDKLMDSAKPTTGRWDKEFRAE